MNPSFFAVRLTFAALLVAAIPLTACASTPRPPPSAYIRAEPIRDPFETPAPHAAAPAVTAASSGSAQSGQMKPLPPPPPHGAGGLPTSVHASGEQGVAEANRQAAQGPARETYFNAIVQYSFEPGSLYQVYASPMRITDIALEPGEKVIGQPAAGDVVRWVLALGKSVQGGQEQMHVYLKPTRPHLETNLAINTDRRSYMLELRSYPDTYMAAVQWHYPHDELARLEAQAAETAVDARNSSPGVGMRE